MVWVCAVPSVTTSQFISVTVFLFFSICCVDYCIMVLLPWFLTYLLVYFFYFKVRKTTFVYDHPNLISESLTCCLKSSAFFPDFYYSFPIPSLCQVASRITVKCKFIVFLRPFSMLMSLVTWVVIRVPEKGRTANICRMTIDSAMLAIRGAVCRTSWSIPKCSLLSITIWNLQKKETETERKQQ